LTRISPLSSRKESCRTTKSNKPLKWLFYRLWKSAPRSRAGRYSRSAAPPTQADSAAQECQGCAGWSGDPVDWRATGEIAVCSADSAARYSRAAVASKMPRAAEDRKTAGSRPSAGHQLAAASLAGPDPVRAAKPLFGPEKRCDKDRCFWPASSV
jgi:hypothetical protein